MKRARLSKKAKSETPPPAIADDLQIPKLVALYGFRCVNDMRVFGKSLNRAFLEWARTYLFVKGSFVWSCASRRMDNCFHRSFIFVEVLRLDILERRPCKWFHAYHATWTIDPQEWHLPDMMHLAATTTSSHPFEIHSTVLLLGLGAKPVDEVQNVEGMRHPIRVKHDHTPDRFCFYVEMKW